MCTVSIIPLDGGGFRLVTNRDEDPARPEASPPAWHERVAPKVAAIWPTDPRSGGTWVAANDLGLVLAVMNGNPLDRAPTPDPEVRLSRGLLIPKYIGSRGLKPLWRRWINDDLFNFEPFRIIAVEPGPTLKVLSLEVNGRQMAFSEAGPWPVAYASSGLGDWRVSPRLALFSDMMRSMGHTPAAQDAFHQHRWPDRPEISVMMDRDGARTVSITRVEVRPAATGRFEVSMEHEPVGVGATR
jgi:hypothetical protein